MLTFIRASLRYKISAQMLLLSLAPLAVVGAVVFVVLSDQLGNFSDRLGQTETALRSDVVGANLAGVADALATEIDAYLLERIKDVRRWAEAPVVVEIVRQANRIATDRGLTTADVPNVEAVLDAQTEQDQSPFFLAPDEQAQQPSWKPSAWSSASWKVPKVRLSRLSSQRPAGSTPSSLAL